jgi:hypothetical protein
LNFLANRALLVLTRNGPRRETTMKKTMQATRDEQTGKTATETYAALRGEIGVQMATIKKVLAQHQRAQKANPLNWGRVGDLGYVKELLDQILGFLGDGR